MQLVSSSIWTRVAQSISYEDNHYTTGTSTKVTEMPVIVGKLGTVSKSLEKRPE